MSGSLLVVYIHRMSHRYDSLIPLGMSHGLAPGKPPQGGATRGLRWHKFNRPEAIIRGEAMDLNEGQGHGCLVGFPDEETVLKKPRQRKSPNQRYPSTHSLRSFGMTQGLIQKVGYDVSGLIQGFILPAMTIIIFKSIIGNRDPSSLDSFFRSGQFSSFVTIV